MTGFNVFIFFTNQVRNSYFIFHTSYFLLNTRTFAAMKKAILSFCLIILFMTACRKYENGAAFTVLTKTKRITKDWVLDAVAVTSGGTITNIVDEYPTMRMRIRKDSVIVLFAPITEKLYGNWAFTESKEAFQWTVDHNPATVIDAATETDMTYDSLGRFDIDRLTNKELWLRDKFNNTLRFVVE
ncbi:MAG: hypothetical protein ACI85O_002565 [Saprospiraceae bacterium]